MGTNTFKTQYILCIYTTCVYMPYIEEAFGPSSQENEIKLHSHHTVTLVSSQNEKRKKNWQNCFLPSL